jgi:hypothetical protein
MTTAMTSPSVWRKVTSCLLVGFALVLGAAAPKAAAETNLEVFLRASNGYSVVIFGRPGHVTLQVGRKVTNGSTYTTYSVPGHADSEGLSASFGGFGRVSVRFRPARGHRLPSHGCGGREELRVNGSFVGTIRFRGEQNFAAVSAKRAKGVALQLCERPAEGRRQSLRRARLQRAPELSQVNLVAATRRGLQSIVLDSQTLEATGSGGNAGATSNLVIADLEEDLGRVSIERVAIVRTEPLVPSPLGVTPLTASLTPPSPFRGTGSYREETGIPPIWSGDLQVDLPGAPGVLLAGPEFKTILCRGKSGEKALANCIGEAIALEDSVDRD